MTGDLMISERRIIIYTKIKTIDFFVDRERDEKIVYVLDKFQIQLILISILPPLSLQVSLMLNLFSLSLSLSLFFPNISFLCLSVCPFPPDPFLPHYLFLCVSISFLVTVCLSFSLCFFFLSFFIFFFLCLLVSYYLFLSLFISLLFFFSFFLSRYHFIPPPSVCLSL